MSRFFMTIIALCKRNNNNNSYNEYNKRATRTNHPILRIRLIIVLSIITFGIFVFFK